MSIYQWYDATADYVEIKFLETLSPSTLINANFALLDASVATPIDIANPFKLINQSTDFYPISRTLRLWFNFTLTPFNIYRLNISGLQNVVGITLSPDSFDFDSKDLAPVIVNEFASSRIPINVEDYSIKQIEPLILTIPANDVNTLEIEIISPTKDTGYFLESSNTEGRIDIQFNQSPAANYVTSDYFKVQRKLVSRNISRWESVNALVTADTANNFIYIYLPSNDATPVYGEPDKIYWEPGYKYRVKILAGVGV